MPSRFSVLVADRAPRLAGSGICLTHTIMFMAAICHRRSTPCQPANLSARVRILLVVNSSASSVTARGRWSIQPALRADNDVEVVETNRRGHATRLAQGAARRGLRRRHRLGGDGTLNEVATGIAGTDAALGVLPGGSTNVFARTLGLPNDPIEAAGALFDGLAAATSSRSASARSTAATSASTPGIGYDAAVVAAGGAPGVVEALVGHPLFISAALTTWFRHYDTAAAPLLRRAGDGTPSTTATSRSSSTRTRTPTWATARSTSPRGHARPGLVAVTSARCGLLPIVRAVGSALARRRRPPARVPRRVHRPRRPRRLVRPAVPVPGRRRLPRRDRAPRASPRARRAAPRAPRLTVRPGGSSACGGRRSRWPA